MRQHSTIVALFLVATVAAFSQILPLSPDFSYVPGNPPTPWLRYRNPAARRVEICGSWDRWSQRYPMQLRNGLWVLDTRELPGRWGYFEYKFIVDGEWEPGANRVMWRDGDGVMNKPSEKIFDATIEDFTEIRVRFRDRLPADAPIRVSLFPEYSVREWKRSPEEHAGGLQGYFLAGNSITFVFDEKVYRRKLSRTDRVTIAGNFNGWDSTGGWNNRWVLKLMPGGTREMTTQLDSLRPPAGESDLLFKFVINGQEWLPPPPGAPNAITDIEGNENLRIISTLAGGTQLRIFTEEPLDLSKVIAVIIEGVEERPIWHLLSPGGVFDRFVSEKPLGAEVDHERNCTTYRLFAPRASEVWLHLYAGPQYEVHKPQYKRMDPVERYPMWKDPSDGVWEITLLGVDAGRYYAFSLDGPWGPGEGFNPWAVIGDPYARAVAHAHNCSIVIDPAALQGVSTGATYGAWRTPELQDLVIYEMHVRDFTMHPSSKVPVPLAGTFEGILATLGTGTGLDHLKSLGVNAVELMPVAEFDNRTRDYSWGYNTAFFFAPEASYGKSPLTGSQYYEFKRLVNELHRHGFAVILDVVYNHVGSPNVFALIDRKYYFRLNPDWTYSNYSKCGNDVRTEAPMVRRFIVDNVLYWMREHGVDGFRFDLGEMVDMDTMMAVAEAARAVNPNVILISEPWSARGENKYQLRGTPWAAWNNEFRYAAKDFALGRHNREWLQKKILGSVDTWAAHPLQSVNYLESHDDMTLADEFSSRPDKDGRYPIERDVAANRVAATILFTSLGIPMINCGQEFLRSKRGINNTFDRGDDVNAVRWTDREKPINAATLEYYRGLIQLRQSRKGASFRLKTRAPPGYYRWIMPDSPKAMGYIVNAPRRHAGAGFVVLLNASDDVVAFDVPLPSGRWRMIGDGRRLLMDGIPGEPVVEGGRTVQISVPPVSSLIFMDGF